MNILRDYRKENHLFNDQPQCDFLFKPPKPMWAFLESSNTLKFGLSTDTNTLNPSFLIANMTSIMYWTRLSISALWRMFRSLSNTAEEKQNQSTEKLIGYIIV